VFAGLALVLFVRPPFRSLLGRSPQQGDPRPAALALALLLLFLLVAGIPLAHELLKLSWLEEPSHYLVVVVAVVAWALLLRFIRVLTPVEARPG
jgi:hypothetical protein